MAEAMPGMAGLPPQTASQPPNGGLTPENLAAFEQARQEMPPSEFAEDLLSTAAEADPIAVAEFKTELRDAQLSPEELNLLDQLVDEVLASPERYPEIRAKYLAQGAPEDLLPPSFDPEFFGALNLAIDEMRVTSGGPLPPQGFAGGGLATLKPIAAAMAQQGRYGDTMLAHISPQEARMLRQMGGSGTINPSTGLPEFFLKWIGKGLKKAARAVKKFLRSKVGRIVTTIALAFFLGPAAAGAMGVSSAAGVAAVSGFVGATGSGLLAGDDVKTSLKAGVIGGIAGGAGAGLFGGAEAFQAGSYTGPTTISGQWDKAKNFFTGAPDTTAATAPTAESFPARPSGAAQITRSPITMDAAAAAPAPAPTGGAGFKIGDMTAAPPTLDLGLGSSGVNLGPTTPSGFTLGGVESVATDGAGAGLRLGDMTGAGAPTGQATDLASRVSQLRQGAQGLTGYDPNTVAAVADPAKEGFLGNVMDKIMPSRIEAAGRAKAEIAFNETLARTGSTELAEKAFEAAMPGMISRYGPMAGVLGAGMYLTGGFEDEDAELTEEAKGIMGTPGMDLLRKYPEIYGLQYGGTYSTPVAPMYNPYYYQPPPANVAKGGSMEKYPDRIGAINGPGTGTSDDIPAMLSDGEFVFTAKAVRNMGDGSRRKGAKRMYALMKKLEDRVHG